jgi:hypothetical protein
MNLIFLVLQEEQVPRTEQVQKEGFLLKRGFVNTAFKRYRDVTERGRICCAGATVERYLPGK